MMIQTSEQDNYTEANDISKMIQAGFQKLVTLSQLSVKNLHFYLHQSKSSQREKIGCLEAGASRPTDPVNKKKGWTGGLDNHKPNPFAHALPHSPL
jgi:hypothetical protein